MVVLPLLLLFAGITIWGFFEPGAAGWLFIGVFAAFAAWLLAATWSLRPSRLSPDEGPYFFSGEEVALFRRYPIYFRYPYTARQYSSTFTAVQVLSIVWLLTLLFNREWALAGAFVAVYLAASNLAPFMNPGHFLRYHGARGHLPEHLVKRLAVLQSIESKLQQFPSPWA